MKYLSLFSGVEAATQAWAPLGWECVGVSEIDPFPCAVLEHHYPDIPNLGDVSAITEEQIKNLGQIDLVVFGSPCQNLSVAGKRTGLAGEQSSLFFEAIRVIEYARKHGGCRFALWENVPGAFSSNKGADFSSVVEHMAGLRNVEVPKHGWGKEGCAVGEHGLLEWACLDAQWFGLAQRRKRVFAIVDFGDWTGRPPVLLERQSLRRDSAPSRDTQEDTPTNATQCLASGGSVTGTILANCGSKHFLGNQEAFSGQYHVLEHAFKHTKTPLISRQTYSFDSLASNSMKSSNPHSGCRPANLAKCLDTGSGCPSRNQGGIAVVESVAIAGNTIGRTEGKAAMVMASMTQVLATR